MATETKPALLFKRGTQQALASAQIIDGAFYLTTDSHRLYAGIGTELVDLNRYIRTVESVGGDTNSLAALTPTANPGDFAYVHEGNILAVYKTGSKHDKDGDGWVQINKNTDTTNSNLTITGDGKTDPGTVTFTLTDTEGKSVSDAITFIGTQGTDVSVDNNGNVTVKGCIYSIEGAANGTNYDIKLNAGDDEVTDTKVTLMAGANITLTPKTGGVEIASTDTKNASVDVSVAGENITVSVKGSDNKTVTDTHTNGLYMTYGSVTGDNALRASNQGHMDVYSIDEIDAKLKGLNGLTYKGTVSAIGDLTGATNVSSGDMYMASAGISGLTSTDLAKFNGVASGVTAFEKGDLFIATGTEGSDGYVTSSTLKWTYVPAGDDAQTDTVYTATLTAASNKFEIKDSNAKTLISNTISNGSPNTLDITSTASGKALTTTIKHKTLTVEEATATTASGGNSVTGIVDLDFDEAGHVTKVTTKTTNLATYTLSGADVSASDNIATIVDSLKDSDNYVRGTSTFKIDASSNDNLNVTASGTSVIMKLEWDTF